MIRTQYYFNYVKGNYLFNNKYFSKYYSKMSSYFKIEKNSRDIILTPTEGYDSVLVFMHGLGDSAEGYRDFFDSKYKPIPNRMKVVLLTAPVAPVTINGGMEMNSWYDIKSFNKAEDTVEESDVITNSYRVKKVIDNEVKAFNGDYSKIFLGGFSQGACLTLHTGLTMDNKLGGLIALSGLLFHFTAKEIQKDSSKNDLNIFIAHGIYDDVIPEPLAKASYSTLFSKNFKNIKYKSYDEVHSISLEEMEDMRNFITKLI
jgi:phospholipase/carboxylesterase